MRRLGSRSGFTLVELLVAMVAGVVVIGAFSSLTQQALWSARARAERAAVLATLRVGAGLLEREVRPAGWDSISGPDLSVSPSGLIVRADRGLRLVCGLRPDTIIVAADSAADWMARSPIPGRDSLLLYLPGDSSSVIDAWLPLPLLATSTVGCPGGVAGVSLVTILDSASLVSLRVPSYTAVRIFESVEIRGYPSSIGWQLGVEERSAGSAIQPVTGPLAPGGLTLAGLDSAGLATTASPGIRGLLVGLIAAPARWASTGLGARGLTGLDSLRVEITLRNR